METEAARSITDVGLLRRKHATNERLHREPVEGKGTGLLLKILRYFKMAQLETTLSSKDEELQRCRSEVKFWRERATNSDLLLQKALKRIALMTKILLSFGFVFLNSPTSFDKQF